MSSPPAAPPPSAAMAALGMPSSETRLRAVGVATLLAGVLPARMEPGRVIYPWSSGLVSDSATFLQVLSPVLTGTCLILVAGMYGSRRIHPPWGAVIVFALWAGTVASVGSSPWIARTLVGGPFARIDLHPLWVIFALAAAACGLEMRLLDGAARLGRRLLWLGAALLLATYALPDTDGLVGAEILEAWLALPSMPASAILWVLPYRLAELAPLAAAVGVLRTARHGERRWSMPLVLHGLAACVVLTGLPPLLLYGDGPSAFASLRAGLLCAAAVEGIQWALVREAKAVISVPSRRYWLSGLTFAIGLGSAAVGWWLASPSPLEPRRFEAASADVHHALSEALPEVIEQGRGAAPDAAGGLVALESMADVWAAAAALVVRGADPDPHRPEWRRRVAALNEALRGAGLAYHADVVVRRGPPPGLDVRPGIRLYAIERVFRHPEVSGPFEIVVGHRPDPRGARGGEVGHVHAGDRVAFVDGGAVRAQADHRALSLVADGACGALPGFVGLDRRCGDLLRGAARQEERPQDERALEPEGPVEALADPLSRSLLRVTVRHEMQHQLDVRGYRVPAAVLRRATAEPPVSTIRLTLEASAQLAEYCTASRLEQAAALAEQLAHLGSDRVEVPDRAAAVVALELLFELDLSGLVDGPDGSALAAILDAFEAADSAELGGRAQRLHPRAFGTPCASLGSPQIAPADIAPRLRPW